MKPCNLLLVVLLVLSCGGVVRAQNSPIPPDFSTVSDTLLVIKHRYPLGYEHDLSKAFSEYYHGPYKIIPKEDTVLYPAEQYRYVFDYRNGTHSETERTMSGFGPERHMNYEIITGYVIRDRQEGIDYNTPYDVRYRKALRQWVTALDGIRPH